MWAYLLLPLAALSQQQQLMEIRPRVPATFMAIGEYKSNYTKPPSEAEKAAVGKLAAEWIKKRATSPWKSQGFKYLGVLAGSPADDLEPGKYQVYRMAFSDSPDVGHQIQMDLLFYGQGKELIWPPEQWDRNAPPPGQMTAVVRQKLK